MFLFGGIRKGSKVTLRKKYFENLKPELHVFTEGRDYTVEDVYVAAEDAPWYIRREARVARIYDDGHVVRHINIHYLENKSGWLWWVYGPFR